MSTSPVYISDSGNASDDEDDDDLKAGGGVGQGKRPSPFSLSRTKSYDTLSRRGSILSLPGGRDPNFNIIPKLKKHNNNNNNNKIKGLNIVEEDENELEESGSGSGNFTETRIIDGVAMTVSTAHIADNKSSPRSRNGSGKKSHRV